MSEMVERVARALRAEFEPHRVFDEGEAERLARASILAMREATEGMIRAGAAVWDDDWCSETNALNMWQAGVDEALK
jgi:hypothetical protein